MGREHEGTTMNTESVKTLPVPPGFASHTSFRLKRIRENEDAENFKDSLDVSEECPMQIDTMSGMSENGTLKRYLSGRPWILSYSGNHESKESEFKQSDKVKPSKSCLPKGVIRGCPDCTNCLKVTARWCPEDARTDILEESPVFNPTEEEFKDTLKYIAKIRPSAERHGICRIVPPPSWKPRCVIKEKNNIWESSKFVTRVQRIDGLQVSSSQSKTASFIEDMQCKRRRTLGIGLDYAYGTIHTEICRETGPGCFDSGQHFESVCGPEFSPETFKIYADEFKSQYFCKSKVTDSNGGLAVLKEQREPSLENIEGEYKRIIDNPTAEIEVLCCDNLEAGVFGSGFPTVDNRLATSSDLKIVNSGWNLNNVSSLRGSLLSLESSETSDIFAPRVRMGMCFSTLPWRVEEHHLYSLCYLHLGAPKIWYGIPGEYSLQLQMALKNLSAELNEEQHDLHHRLVKELSPSALNSEGIPVFRCIQNPREFVLVFPGACHSAFDCGFNCSETASFAPLDWLPHGQNAVELYRELGRKTSLSHDKLLLRAASAALREQWDISFMKEPATDNQLWKDSRGKEGILTKALKSRVKSEDITRKYLCNSSQTQRMDETFDATRKRECKICLCDLHFSAAGCPCSADTYSCLNHAKQLCSCAWTEKFFLIKYDISELNMLVEALEGKLSSVFKWCKDKLGLSFSSSYSAKKGVQASRQGESSTSHSDKLEQKEKNSQSVATPNSTSGSFSNILEEIKARRLQSKENATSVNAVRPGIREEIKARLLQASKLKAKEDATKSHNWKFSSCSNADVNMHAADSTTMSNKPEEKRKKAAPAFISSIDKVFSYIQTGATSEVSSGSSIETSSEESDSDGEMSLSSKF